jgi:hypothetical protein
MLKFFEQFGDLSFQSINLAPLRGDRFIEFRNRPVLVRDQRFQSVQAKRI